MTDKRRQKWTRSDALAALRYLHKVYGAAPAYLAHYTYMYDLELALNPTALLLPPERVFKFWRNIGEAWRAAGIPPSHSLETLETGYQFDAATDERILRVCRQLPVRKKRLEAFREIGKSVGIPVAALGLRAVQLGHERRTHTKWTGEEREILRQMAHLSKQSISKALSQAGYKRSFNTANIIKARRKAQRAPRPSHYSMQQLADLFGLDSHTIGRWLTNGWLGFEMKGTARTRQQGGDTYLISRAAVREFVRQYPELYDLRKVDQKWFIDLLCEYEENIAQRCAA